MNGVLKLILGQIILEMNLEAKLAGEFRQTGFTTFSEPARKFCSEALSELIRRMGTPERRQKIVEGFEQTLLGPVRHSELEGVLELGRELERDHPVELETRKSHPCPHGCGETFSRKLNPGTQRLKRHEETCWCCRNQLLPPVVFSYPVLLNADFPVALEAEVVDPAGQRRTVGFDTNGTACDLETGVELEDKWWKTHKVVRYGPVLWLMKQHRLRFPEF